MIYGYIIGEFDIDTLNDEWFEVERLDNSLQAEDFLCIETARDLSGLNFTIIGNNIAFNNWLSQNAIND